MRVVLGTHTLGQIEHVDSLADENLLSRGQEVRVEVDESQAVDIELEPGEMSLHHVRIVHGSNPNPTDVPRIGFVVRYIATSCRQTGPGPGGAGARRGPLRPLRPAAVPGGGVRPGARAIHDAAMPIIRSILFRDAAKGPRKPS